MLKRVGQKQLALVSTDDHINDMGKLAEKYSSETGTKELEYNYEQAFAAVKRGLEDGNFIGILAYVDGEPVAMVSAWLSFTYYTQPIAFGDMLYVVPEHRRGPLGRIMFKLLEDTVRDEVSSLYVSIAGNMPTDKSLTNMFRRLGLEEVGMQFKRVY